MPITGRLRSLDIYKPSMQMICEFSENVMGLSRVLFNLRSGGGFCARFKTIGIQKKIIKKVERSGGMLRPS